MFSGGGGGIRTPETLSSLTVFKTAAFSQLGHSSTLNCTERKPPSVALKNDEQSVKLVPEGESGPPTGRLLKITEEQATLRRTL